MKKTTTHKPTIKRHPAASGGKWCRPEKRLAIYIRDGLSCVYCGHSVEDGTKLTLDHVKPHSKGGDNSETNLVTACQKCNSSRGNRSLSQFCKSVADYLNEDADDIYRYINNQKRRKIDRAQAKEIISRRRTISEQLSEAHSI